MDRTRLARLMVRRLVVAGVIAGLVGCASHFDKGAEAAAARDYATADREFGAEIDEGGPRRAEAHYQRSLVRLSSGKNSEALADFERAATLDASYRSHEAEFADAYYARAVSAAREGNDAGASADLAVAVRLKPELERQTGVADARYSRLLSEAQRLEAENRPVDAVAAYRGAMSAKEDGGQASAQLRALCERVYMRAVQSLREGNYADGMREWECALRLDPGFAQRPEYPEALFDYGVDLSSKGIHGEQEIEKAIRMRPELVDRPTCPQQIRQQFQDEAKVRKGLPGALVEVQHASGWTQVTFGRDGVPRRVQIASAGREVDRPVFYWALSGRTVTVTVRMPATDYDAITEYSLECDIDVDSHTVSGVVRERSVTRRRDMRREPANGTIRYER